MNVKIIKSIACAIAAALLLAGVSQIAVLAEPQEITMCILEDVEVSY